MKNKPDEKRLKADRYWTDIASVLSHMKRFQKAVVDARTKWGIPKTGLSYDKRASWYASLFNPPTASLKDNYYTSTQNELLPPNDIIRSTLKEISNEFNLDNRWHHSLLLHIASDDVPLAPPNGLPYVEVRLKDNRLPQDKWVVKRMWIEIYQDTTQDDIEVVWNQVQRYQAMMSVQYPKKRRPLQKVDKYIKIRELEKQEMTQQQIADNHPELEFYTAKDIAGFKKQIEKHFSPKKTRK